MSRTLLLVALAITAVSAAKPFPRSQWVKDDTYTDGTKASFDAWRAQYGREYASTAEYDHAFHNFQATARRVLLKNLAQSKAGFKVGKFADLSPEEFKAQYLTLDGKAVRAAMKEANVKVAEPRPLSAPLPADFDWAQVNPSPVSEVKDQGQCGSCWAFSVTENIESQYFIAGKYPNNQLVDLSPQQIVDCDTNSTDGGWGDDGCNGGFTQGAFTYVINQGGIQSESDYPYYSGDDGFWGPCQVNTKKFVASIKGWEYAIPTCNDACTNQNTTLLMQQLVAIGPFSICVVATDDWQDYSWGVLMGYCPMDAADINHGVQLTGYMNGKNEGWWVVRNSWNEDWGMNGYIWVDMPNDCGVADIATYALV